MQATMSIYTLKICTRNATLRLCLRYSASILLLVRCCFLLLSSTYILLVMYVRNTPPVHAGHILRKIASLLSLLHCCMMMPSYGAHHVDTSLDTAATRTNLKKYVLVLRTPSTLLCTRRKKRKNVTRQNEKATVSQSTSWIQWWPLSVAFFFSPVLFNFRLFDGENRIPV